MKLRHKTAPHHLKALEEQKLEFDSNDKATRRATLRMRGFREMARPWRVQRHVMNYWACSRHAVFHQGARVN